eukprot:scaffold3208_cov113-Isochrysis_galbana.AAC.3
MRPYHSRRREASASAGGGGVTTIAWGAARKPERRRGSIHLPHPSPMTKTIDDDASREAIRGPRGSEGVVEVDPHGGDKRDEEPGVCVQRQGGCSLGGRRPDLGRRLVDVEVLELLPALRDVGERMVGAGGPRGQDRLIVRHRQIQRSDEAARRAIHQRAERLHGPVRVSACAVERLWHAALSASAERATDRAIGKRHFGHGLGRGVAGTTLGHRPERCLASHLDARHVAHGHRAVGPEDVEQAFARSRRRARRDVGGGGSSQQNGQRQAVRRHGARSLAEVGWSSAADSGSCCPLAGTPCRTMFYFRIAGQGDKGVHRCIKASRHQGIKVHVRFGMIEGVEMGDGAQGPSIGEHGKRGVRLVLFLRRCCRKEGCGEEEGAWRNKAHRGIRNVPRTETMPLGAWFWAPTILTAIIDRMFRQVWR